MRVCAVQTFFSKSDEHFQFCLPDGIAVYLKDGLYIWQAVAEEKYLIHMILITYWKLHLYKLSDFKFECSHVTGSPKLNCALFS